MDVANWYQMEGSSRSEMVLGRLNVTFKCKLLVHADALCLGGERQ